MTVFIVHIVVMMTFIRWHSKRFSDSSYSLYLSGLIFKISGGLFFGYFYLEQGGGDTFNYINA
ncbi:MAG: hypothetical protein WBA74_18215, partial [Cyclobacteriaceae bacterium]